MEQRILIGLLYIVIISLYGLLLMSKDKLLAKQRRRRLSERRLFAVAVIGGSPGIWLGIWVFRHKTKHTAFTLGIPMIMLVQGVIVYWLRNTSSF